MTRPPLRYRGGKSKLCSKIIATLPPHRCYVEVFGGAGWVLFNKGRSKVEAYNDWNLDLTNLFRCIREHGPEVRRLLEGHVVSHDEFYRLKSMPPEHLTDIQRAVRYVYMMNYGVTGDADSHYYAAGRSVAPLHVVSLQELTKRAEQRLQGVWVDRRRYESEIEHYDATDTAFYLDPPYWDSENTYGPGFDRGDYSRLREVLLSVKGRFLMTLNDRKPVWDMFGCFSITRANRPTLKWGGDLFISNYDHDSISITPDV